MAMSINDLNVRYEGDLSTRYDEEYLQVKLEEAEALVASECPTALTRLASGALSQTNYKRIVADIVFRVIRNPGGVISESEGGVSYGLRSTVASGDLWVSDNDRRTLTGITPESKRTFPGTASLGVDDGWAR